MKKWFENNSNSFWLVTYLFIATKLCLHFFTNTNYELHRDEMLYFNMADHLDWGYASVPPLIGGLAFLVKTIFGYSVFGIRFFPALMGAASMYLMAKILHRLGGGMFALVVALSSFLLSTGFLLIDTLFTPNAVEHFLWLLITWYLFKMTSDNNPKLWIWIGIFIGLTFLNKYSVVFLVAGFLVALLLSPHRKLFYSRYFIYAIFIAFVIVLPNIYWQYAHHWPVLFHMKELQSTQLVNMKYSHFLIDAFTLNLISSVFWLLGLCALLFIPKEKKFQYLGIGSLLIMLLFLFSNGKGYYILGLLPLLFAFGGYAMEKYVLARWKRFSYAITTSTIVVSLLALPYALPILSFDSLKLYKQKTGNLIIYPFYRWEDGKVHPISQVYSDMTGWNELTGYVIKAYNRLSEDEKKTCTIFAEHNYGYASAIHFYGRSYELPDAITFSDSYVLWAPESIPEGPIIYLYFEPGQLVNLYHSIIEVGCVNDPYFREKGLKVFLCTNPKTSVAEVYAQLAYKEKLIFRK